MNCCFIGFDFSINKPACTLFKDGQFYYFIWPISLTENETKKYFDSPVIFRDRKLEKLSKKSKFTTSEMTLEHTKRSTELANYIIKDITNVIGNISNYKIYVASEGLSFASVGNSNLDLATYKGVLLNKIYENLTTNIYTYAPITIKKVAGIDKKSDFLSKTPMIDAYKKEYFPEGQDELQKLLLSSKLLAKTNYIDCVDDIIDSYFACKTMYKKEKLSGIKIWDE